MDNPNQKEYRSTRWMLVAGVVGVLIIFSLPFLRPSRARQVLEASPAPSVLATDSTTPQPSPWPDQVDKDTVIIQQPAAVPTGAVSPYLPVSSVSAGQPAPDFTLNTLDGGSITLSDLRGQPVIINFWASWCYPCRLEMPELQQVYTTYQSKGLVILGINVTSQDTLADAQAFVAEFNPSFPILLDETGEVTARYGVRGIPTSVFVGRDGVISHLQLGALNRRQLEEFVAEILE